jgi:hypothetical protein
MTISGSRRGCRSSDQWHISMLDNHHAIALGAATKTTETYYVPLSSHLGNGGAPWFHRTLPPFREIPLDLYMWARLGAYSDVLLSTYSPSRHRV